MYFIIYSSRKMSMSFGSTHYGPCFPPYGVRWTTEKYYPLWAFAYKIYRIVDVAWWYTMKTKLYTLRLQCKCSVVRAAISTKFPSTTGWKLMTFSCVLSSEVQQTSISCSDDCFVYFDGKTWGNLFEFVSFCFGEDEMKETKHWDSGTSKWKWQW